MLRPHRNRVSHDKSGFQNEIALRRFLGLGGGGVHFLGAKHEGKESLGQNQPFITLTLRCRLPLLHPFVKANF
ncbi:hypothetical protein [[Phormidium] sp. ETS-05]|uniref:hypothetical protein n=1 Tax=[Phormidium] sp. ETS-05 TaxID=222819 RepID=UPI0018EEEF79|nr:hypothetical protein [[Phormidium] sp. ETS-05]